MGKKVDCWRKRKRAQEVKGRNLFYLIKIEEREIKFRQRTLCTKETPAATTTTNINSSRTESNLDRKNA